MAEILRNIEREWTAEFRSKRFAQLKALLALLRHCGEAAIGVNVMSRAPHPPPTLPPM
jgi:hypothetical protein